MTDSIAVFPPGERILDSSGAVVSGGTLYFYDAGTTSPRTVYSSSTLTTALGVSVVTDSGGYPSTAGNRVLIYTGTTAYKIVCKDAASVELWSHDNIKGAVDTSLFLTSAGTTVTYTMTPVTTSGTWVVGDVTGKVFEANPTAASFTRTLPLAATSVGVPFDVVHTGSANIVTLLAQGANFIQIEGTDTARKALLLQNKGDSVRLISNGVDYRAIFKSARAQVLNFVVEDLRTAPPGSPVVGGYYLINGAPSGTFASIGCAANDIVMYDGQSNYQIFRPPANSGWTALDKSIGLTYRYEGAVWSSLEATTSRSGFSRLATQAEMETATSLTIGVTAGSVQWHPGVCKAWVVFAGATGTVATSYNVSSVTRASAGQYTVNFTTAFSTPNFSIGGTVVGAAGGVFGPGTVTTTTCALTTYNTGFAAADFTSVRVMFFGDQL